MKAKRFVAMLMAMLMVVGLFAMPASAEDTSIMPRGLICANCNEPMLYAGKESEVKEVKETLCIHGKPNTLDECIVMKYTQSWRCRVCSTVASNTWTENSYICLG